VAPFGKKLGKTLCRQGNRIRLCNAEGIEPMLARRFEQRCPEADRVS